jgi:hypothetical protein
MFHVHLWAWFEGIEPTDFAYVAPVTTKLKELCPSKKIGIIVPQNQSAMNLKQHADFFKKIRDRDLKKSLSPEQITYNGKLITAPAGWLPKPKQDNP